MSVTRRRPAAGGNNFFTLCGYVVRVSALTTSLDFAAADELDRRLYGRSSAFLLAFVELEGVSYPVSLRNLSQGGALVEAEAGFLLETAVTFRRLCVAQPARIVWHRAGRFGLVFDEPLASEDVEQIRRRVAAKIVTPLR